MSLIPYLAYKCGLTSDHPLPTVDAYLSSQLNYKDDCKYLRFLRQSTDPDSDMDPIEFSYKIRSDGVTLAPFDAKDHHGQPITEDPYTRELVDGYLDFLYKTGDYESGLNVYIENAFFQACQSWDAHWFQHGFFTIEPDAPRDNKQRFLLRLTGVIDDTTIHENGSIFKIDHDFYGYLGSEYRYPTEENDRILRRRQSAYDYKFLSSAFWHEVVEPLVSVYPDFLTHKIITPDWSFADWKQFAQQLNNTNLEAIACLHPLSTHLQEEWFMALKEYMALSCHNAEIPLHMG